MTRDDLDPREIRVFLQSLQAGEMSVSRAIEILDAWVNGTYSPDMVPPPPPDSGLITDDDFPLDVLRRERATMRTMVDQLVNANSIKACAQAIQVCEQWLQHNTQ